jgi:ribosomal protein S15P/S13E
MDEAEQRGLQSLMKKKREVDDYWQFKNFNPFQNSPQQP